MSFIKKEAQPVKNGVKAIQEDLLKEFETVLTANDSFNLPIEIIKDIEDRYDTAYLQGKKNNYPAITYSFGTHHPDQAEYLVRAMAVDILSHKEPGQVLVFRKKLDVDVENNRLIARTRVSFVFRDDLETCLNHLKSGN